MTPLKIYLSGPMRRKPNENHDLFNSSTALLRRRQFTVFNPVELSRDLLLSRGLRAETLSDFQVVSFQDYLKHDYAYVMQSDVVAVLPDWRQSEGAIKEVSRAREVGIPVYDLQTVLDFGNAFGPSQFAMSLEVPESAVQEAHRLVHGSRMADYGHPIDDYTRTGRIWGAILDGWLRTMPGFATIPPVPDVDPRIAGLMMGGVKISREVNKPKHDNRVDMAGYAEVVELIAKRQDEDSK